jgi:hypothetical protein
MNSDPQISAGANGQIVVIKGTDNSKTVTFIDGAGLSLAGDMILGLNDTLVLMYDSTEELWIEISRSDN